MHEFFSVQAKHFNTQHTMDYQTLVILAFSYLCLHFLIHLFTNTRKSSKLPPGPKPLPIIGNILQLSDSNRIHSSLANLSKIYGPLMTLELGSMTTIVVSSPDLTKEIFQIHDKSFSGRKQPDVVRAMDHHTKSLAWSHATPLWRYLRKISVVHLFTKHQLDVTQHLRQKKVHELVEYVNECCKNGRALDIGNAAFTTGLNLLSNTFFSIDLAKINSEKSQEFSNLISNIMVLCAKPNISDFFPGLRYFDLFGLRGETEGCFGKILLIFDEIIKKRLSVASTEDDVLTTLLKINKENANDLSLEHIKHLLLDLFVAGTDTTSVSLEWALTELIRNPDKMAKAQAELDQVVGKGKLVQESDIERLPYLQAVVKETFRLHPPGPLLIPHKSENEVSLRGYVIPKDTVLLVNIWTMSRDQNMWKNPEIFDPERFVGSEIDMKGQHFELIPFGAGRRICPGMPMAHRMLHIMLATLIHSFNWKLEGGMRGEDVDVTEKLGISLRRVNPLLLIPLAK